MTRLGIFLRKLLSTLKKLILIPIVFYVMLIPIATFDYSAFTWQPSKIYNDVRLWITELITTPQIKEKPTKTISKLVEAPYIQAFLLIKEDERFEYLADFAIRYKIHIVTVKSGCSKNFACYQAATCHKPGTVYVMSPQIAAARVDRTASVLVHEISHAYYEQTKKDYNCGKTFLSEEFYAYSKENLFLSKYSKPSMVDRNGVLSKYCLYIKIKADYSDLYDDIRLQPPDSSFENFLCNFTSLGE